MRPLVSANSGSQTDDDENILNISSDDLLKSLNIPEKSPTETDSSSESGNSSPTRNRNITLEDCGVVYFAGYLAKKCLDKYNCQNCKYSLESKENINNTDELLTFYKNYDLKHESGLKIPTPLMKKFTFACLNVFSKNIGKYIKEKIISKLKRKMTSHLHQNLPEWYDTSSLCNTHREYILDLLLRTQVYKYCKEFSNSSLSTNKDYKNVKLSILKHK